MTTNKFMAISVIIATVFIGGAVLLSNTSDGSDPQGSKNNVTIVNGKQIIDLRAKGGYSPKRSTAKAGIPTILKVNTNGTFDCSSALRIPSMNISKNLPPSGSTEIDLGSPQAGLLKGTCGMGMYQFEINFQS